MISPSLSRKSSRPPSARASLTVEALEERCLLSADPVLEWNSIALDALRNDSTLAHPHQNNPGNASWALAIESAAVFDAINSIDRSYDPYLIEVNAPASASITAAAAQAAHDTLVALFPEYQPTLDARLANDLTHGSLQSRVEGVLVGHVVASAILAVRSHDGAAVSVQWPAGTQPGQWQPDPLHSQQSAWGTVWGDVTPFTLTSSTQFHVLRPPALTSLDYANAYNEVKAIGGDGITTPTTRTVEQTQIGIFWGYDGSPGVGTPPIHYNQIAQVLAVQMHNSVTANARFFALINLAMADSGIAGWESKFEYDFWRPVTAIRAGDTDGNSLTDPDPTWTPLGAPEDNGGGSNFTPPFPAYVSGHAAFGGALFRMMADFFGSDTISFTIGSDEFNGITSDQNGVVRPVVTRSYTSFSQAAEENGQSRIYLGIHWVFDKVQGIALGDSIADYVFSNFLRPSSAHGRDMDMNGANELLYAQTSTTNGPALTQLSSGANALLTAPTNTTTGPVLTQVPTGPGETEMPNKFSMTQDLQPVNFTVKVESARLVATAHGNPKEDLDAAFASPSLFDVL